ncbi:MAG: metallophosphoesterase family protein [bacterium]
MKKYLGIISDTHISNGAKLHPKIYNLFKEADGIIHAGDLTDMKVLKELEMIASVWAVYGNMDAHTIRQELPEKRIVEWEGKRIGIIHRSKSPDRENPEGILPLFSNDNIDCLIFGHSHKPCNKIISRILCFNPGSPSGQYGQTPSVGCLYIEGSLLVGKITSIT